MGWFDKEKIELLRNNFSYIAVIALCYVILRLQEKNDKLQLVVDDLRERQYKHALDDVQIFQRAFEFINPAKSSVVHDTLYFSTP